MFKFYLAFYSYFIIFTSYAHASVNGDEIVDLQEKVEIDLSNANKEIPKILHAVWVGPEPIPPELEKNLLETMRNFQDFELHLWTSWEEEENPYPKEIIVHRKKELRKILLKYKVDAQRTLIDYVNKEMEFRIYACAKDIIQFVLLFEYGGIFFDLDVQLTNKIRSLSGKSQYGYYSYPISPALMSSAPNHIFPKIALVFFVKMMKILESDNYNRAYSLDLKILFPRTSGLLTTGSMILFASRILELKTSPENLHLYALMHRCKICHAPVFMGYELSGDVSDSDTLLQDDSEFSEYFTLIPISSLKDPDLRTLDSTSSSSNKISETLRFGRSFLENLNFQTFKEIVGEGKFFDCWEHFLKDLESEVEKIQNKDSSSLFFHSLLKVVKEKKLPSGLVSRFYKIGLEAFTENSVEAIYFRKIVKQNVIELHVSPPALPMSEQTDREEEVNSLEEEEKIEENEEEIKEKSENTRTDRERAEEELLDEYDQGSLRKLRAMLRYSAPEITQIRECIMTRCLGPSWINVRSMVFILSFYIIRHGRLEPIGD